MERDRSCSNEKFLQSELESVNQVHSKELGEITSKLHHQIEGLKQREHELLTENGRLENQCEDLSNKLESVEQDLKEAIDSKPAPKQKSRDSDVFLREIQLERTIQELTDQNKEQEVMLQDLTKQNSQFSATIEELKDKVMCLEDNLESKKSELKEKEELFESTHEQLNELNIELAMYKSAPDSDNRKGNSLFAEVDDQRQKMKEILQKQNQTYLDMKKSYNCQKMEIRRLKRENVNIKQEIQACSNLFHRADQVYIRKYLTIFSLVLI